MALHEYMDMTNPILKSKNAYKLVAFSTAQANYVLETLKSHVCL